jgi:hypothetical protein
MQEEKITMQENLNSNNAKGPKQQHNRTNARRTK